MHVIRILPRAHAPRAKPNPPPLHIHALDPAHHPLAARDLIFHAPRRRVVEIQMIPPIALAHPNQLARRLKPVRETLRGKTEKRLALLVHHRARRARIRVHRHDAKHLMPALIVIEREPPRVRRPAQFAQLVRIRKQRLRDRKPLAIPHIEQPRPRQRDAIPRLRVIQLMQLRLHLILRRRLDQMHLALLALANLPHRQPPRVRRPMKPGLIRILRRPVRRQRELLLRLGHPHEHIVVAHKRPPFPIRRLIRSPALRRRFRRNLCNARCHRHRHHRLTAARPRLENAERFSRARLHRPHVPDERVLRVPLARFDAAVAATLARGINPKQRHFLRRLIHKRQRGLLLTRPARARLRTRRLRRHRHHRARLRRDNLRHLVTRQHAPPPFPKRPKLHRLAPARELDFIKRQPLRPHLAPARLRQRRRHSRVLKRRAPLPFHRIHQNKFAHPTHQIIAIPKRLIPRQPVRRNAPLENLPLRPFPKTHRPLVIRPRPLREPTAASRNREQQTRPQKPSK